MKLMNLSRSTDEISHRWSTSFSSMIYIDKMLAINYFDVSIGFFYTVENQALCDMAFEQVEMFFSILMSNVIMISKEDHDNDELKDFENNVFMVPGKANDQTIGSQIFLKLVNIVGENLSIEHITISSVLGKNIEYTIDMDSPELTKLLPTREEWWDDENVKFQPWWLRDDSATYDVLINRDEIYTGVFKWSDMFEKELEEAKIVDNAKNKFKIIDGGKNVH
jgi:hypothetical protein